MHRRTYRALGVAAALFLAGEGRGEWRGVDLSYVNELEDCGVVYRSGEALVDPYETLAAAGANLVRLRLWVAPEWTRYSTLDDVVKSMGRARAAGMNVLLDFHYSNDWAHPGKQLRPDAWPPADDPVALAKQVHAYTRATLNTLHASVGLPDFVAVGNEINTNLLVDEETDDNAPIDWPRNAALLQAGIEAVRGVARETGRPMTVMLHVAQPENVPGWFDAALAHGVVDFDVIGISYYPKWSRVALADLGDRVGEIRERFGRRVAIVETAYPWTLEGRDPAGNILGEDSLVAGYPATPEGQARFLRELRGSVRRAGGAGIIYWEPAWVTSSCETRWGKGSHWENATLFDFDHELLPGAATLLTPQP
jgi:arabinogalactan endo-1,4-beta-galactosidase